MSYAVKRSDIVPAGQSDAPTTAAVREHICLFTNDLRRKQKRWQDGRLHYHTFNKRVMVYDDRGHFIGDAHWQADGGDLEDGDELELDRGAAIVQVSECVASREQDLTEVVDKRAREVEKRRAEAAGRSSGVRARPTPSMAMAAPTATAAARQPLMQSAQMRHKPLSSIVPSPGPLGRANIPGRSPYEARVADRRDTGTEGDRPAKRRKHGNSSPPPSKAGFAQSLFGTRLTLSAVPMSTPASRPLRDATNLQMSSQSSSLGKDQEIGRWSTAISIDDDEDAVDGRSNLRSSPPPSGQQKERHSNPGRADGNVQRYKGIATAKKRTPIPNPHSQYEPDVIVLEVGSPHVKPTDTRDDHVERTTPRATGKRTRTAVIEAGADRTSLADPDDPSAYESEQASIRWEHNRAENPPLGDFAGRKRAEGTQKHDKPACSAPSKQTKVDTASGKDNRGSHGTAHSGIDANATETKQTLGTAEMADAVNPTGCSVAALRNQEPRTELRIKPRKRRGLLMMSENARNSRARDAEPVDQPVVAETETRSDHGSSCERENDGDSDNQAPQRPTRRVTKKTAQRPRQGSISTGSASEGSRGHQHEAATRARRKLRSTPLATRNVDHTDSASESHSDANDVPSLQHRTNSGKRDETESAAPGPRISKMVRKSVRSKEIFGFVPFGNSNSIPAPIVTATESLGPARNVGSAAARAADATNEVSQVAAENETNSSDAGDHRRRSPDGDRTEVDRSTAPRIANPATRGRKAASKEDAAGQVPQHVVPREPVTMVGARVVAPAVSPGKKAALPGFSNANGGAWSKHAEDLLGMHRPVGSEARRVSVEHTRAESMPQLASSAIA